MSRKLIEKAEALLEKEKGTVFKEPGGRLNICLVYPNTYHVGMSNLGFQGIYTLLNKRDDVLCERAFLPDAADMEEYERTGAELFSLESKRPLGRFDIVAFSVSFENDYPNVLRILELSKIPLRPSERRGHHPLLIIGGVCAFSNPEPLAEFFDISFTGEAEEMLYEFIEEYGKSRTRDELLRNSLRIDGLYVPRFYETGYDRGGMISERRALYGAPGVIKRRFIKDISKVRFSPSIITSETEFRGMYLIEAMRGCPWNCSFCLAGHVYNPPRKKPLDAIKNEIKDAKGVSEKIGIIGPSLTDYPYLEDVLCIEGVDFSITSLRASPKSARIVGLMKGSKSVSIAPEAGTERLRRVINKKITEEDIIETSRLIFQKGMERLRLYFMAGLPTETDEDIAGIAGLVRRIRGLSERGMVILTVSAFVPKPFTPFQWHPMEKAEVIKRRLKLLKKALIPMKGVKVFHDVPKYAYMQGLFSMGDRRISGVLEEMLVTPDWRKAASKRGISPDFYISRHKEFSETLPWDFIDSGMSKEALWKEYQGALGI
ncbi:MAG: radical SAM protein [Thermodesulfovibrionales bacterium]|nr:radical SAM protein [Thermodesulfovibrionales bacterium]